MELENLCLAEAGQRFTQVSKTPFLKSPLIDILMEANLSTKAFDQVLEGTFVCPEAIDEMMQHLLVALQRPDNISLIQPQQLGDITARWHKAWEATLSSPSLIHSMGKERTGRKAYKNQMLGRHRKSKSVFPGLQI